MASHSPKRHTSMVNMRKAAQDQPQTSASLPLSTSEAPKRRGPVDITNGLVPASATDAYLDRLKGWTDVVRRLISHFECIVEQERKLADVYFKSAKDLSSPIKVQGAEVFGVDETIQNVLKNLFDAQSKLSSEHLSAASHIESETLPELRSLLGEVRKKSIDADKEWVSLDKGLARDREVEAVNPDIGIDKDVPKDPWIANLHMQRHVRTLLRNQHETRDHLASQEQNFAVFEQVTLQHLRLALTNHFTVSNKIHSAHLNASTSITSSLNAMNPTADWEIFRKRRADVLLNRIKPLIQERDVMYDGMTDPGCEAVKEGALQKTAKGFKPGYYVLTVSGFLHGFAGPEVVEGGEPTEMSVWLPDCTVGSKGALDSKEPHEFMVQEKTGGFLKGGEKFRLKAEGGDESDFWYELISATATPIVPRPDLLESLEEEASPRPSQAIETPLTPRTEPLKTPPSASAPLKPTPSTPVSVTAVVTSPVDATSPTFAAFGTGITDRDGSDLCGVWTGITCRDGTDFCGVWEYEEEEEIPADLAAMRSEMFSAFGGKPKDVGVTPPTWGSTTEWGGDDDSSSPWS
ncbi:hypothetical protein BC829DRAFT_389824 [Chytridium lagenaria]|nr:hypothetical protein BC829DRAFT_389824 [Chytridium lagenaria]